MTDLERIINDDSLYAADPLVKMALIHHQFEYMLDAVEGTARQGLATFLKNDLGVTRLTATRYLDALVADGILEKGRIGRSNYYINTALYAILTGEGMTDHGV